ncbi:MAG: LysM peptidoglycan-binding domain-containing protein [Microbacterium sp.]
MTAIDFAGSAPLARLRPVAPATRTTRLRLTTRGRRALVFLASVPAVVVLSFVLVSGGALAANEGGAPAGTFEYVTVMPGDTLWSIAESAAPDADPRDVVDAIMRLNALSSGTLDSGQSLAIPLEYSAER